MIEKFRVHNFRCLEDFTLDLSGKDSVLLIGKNGAGKSAVRAAIGVLRNVCRGTNRVKEWIKADDYTRHRHNVPMRFEIDLVLSGQRFQYLIAFELPENFHEARVVEERLTVDGEIVFDRSGSHVGLKEGAAFGLDWHVAALPVIHAGSEKDVVSRLRRYLASILLIAPLPSEMSGFAEEESFELNDDAANVAAWLSAMLLRHPDRYADIVDYLREVIPDFQSVEFVPRGERGKQLRVRFESREGENRGQLALDFKQLSDGEKCLFLSALVVAFNRPDDPRFCFWDEPDNHLSLPEVSHFIMELRRLSNQQGQFIATSHHPEAICRFSDENTMVLTRASRLEPTLVRPLGEISYPGDLIDALIRDEVFG